MGLVAGVRWVVRGNGARRGAAHGSAHSSAMGATEDAVLAPPRVARRHSACFAKLS
jgi:hypothetical protein